ncbi:hypothetical protein ACQP00_31105 [Dactylosporangium sp. CS-047395]|uniref:hypothetical protein n=1 Tax=Dactylosporangium sp. CS-047395 TaxID=3239936 RepID=UPI003D8D4087
MDRKPRLGGSRFTPPGLFTELGLDVEVVLEPCDRLVDDLGRGDLDAVILSGRFTAPEGAEHVMVASHRTRVAMRHDDPFAALDPIWMGQVWGRDHVGVGTHPDADWATLADHVRRTGVLAEILPLETGGDIGVFADPAFTVRPVHGGPSLRFDLFWPAERAGSPIALAATARWGRNPT